MNHRLLSLLCPFLLGAALACGSQSKPETPPLPKSDLPETYLLSAQPAGARTVLELRASPPIGQKVAITGRVREFVNGLSAFTLIDPSMKACNEGSPMDDCPTPWDFCCDDPVVRRRASATVEFRNGEKLHMTGVRGFHGIDHLTRVVVTGMLQQDAAGNLSVIADGIYVGA